MANLPVRPETLDQLLARLNISGLQGKNTPLYEVIAELIKIVRKLANNVNSGSSGGGGGSSVINITEIAQFLSSSDGDGGGDGEVIPGPRGLDGATGSQGPAGNPTLGPMYLDPGDPEEPMVIPGPKGDTGASGASGAAGPPTLGPMSLEPELPDDPPIIPGPKGDTGNTGDTGATGATGPQSIGFMLAEDGDKEELPQMVFPPGLSPWEFITSQIVAGATNYDFTNLGGYSEILVLIDGVTRSGAVVSQLRVSTDNGATFLSTSGDYITISTAGVETNLTGVAFFTTAATAARSGWITIMGFNQSVAPKVALAPANPSPAYFIPTTTAFNAVRVTVSAGTQDAGTIYVYGRK